MLSFFTLMNEVKAAQMVKKLNIVGIELHETKDNCMKTWKKSLITAASIILPLFTCIGANYNFPSQRDQVYAEQERPAIVYSWLIGQAQVKPEEVPSYEQKLSALINKAKTLSLGGVQAHYHAPTSTYFLLYPMHDIQNWEENYQNWNQESDITKMKNHLQNYTFMLTRTVPEFSRVPFHGHLNKINPNFAHIDIIELQPGSEQRFKELLQEWASQVKLKAPDCVWFVHKILIGRNLPAYYLFRGDCINAAETNGVVPLEKFLMAQQALGSIVKKIDSYNLEHLSRLSTVPFPVNPL
jgi:hypothetical protein